MTDKRRDIFNFNHISEKLDKHEIQKKECISIKKTYQCFNKMKLVCNITSALLVTSGTISGGLTFNPVILGILPSIGVILKVYTETKKL